TQLAMRNDEEQKSTKFAFLKNSEKVPESIKTLHLRKLENSMAMIFEDIKTLYKTASKTQNLELRLAKAKVEEYYTKEMEKSAKCFVNPKDLYQKHNLIRANALQKFAPNLN